MRVIKLVIIFALIFILSYGAGWLYITNKIVTDLNAKYAGRQFFAKGPRGDEYYAKFDRLRPTGFPFSLAVKIEGWQEESREANLTYSAPIIVGYDLLTQQVFTKFHGQIKAAYKPDNGFGARLEIGDYRISADFPLSSEVIEILVKKKDPFRLINNIGEIRVSTGKVEIFDLMEGGKFYDKQYERMYISFVPAKKYESMEDFLTNIPGEYNINYEVKTNLVKEESRKVPVSLFYGFFMYPSDFVASGKAKIKTNAKNFANFKKDMELGATFSFSASLFDMPEYSLTYKGNMLNLETDFSIASTAKIRVKNGFFDELFRYYGLLRPHLLKSSIGKFVNNEILYVINNKDVFRFKDLENSNYDLNLEMQCAQNKKRQHVNIANFSILSDKSGIRLRHDSEAKFGKPTAWNASGVFYINNYPSVVDFSSGYIYRFGKFRILSEEIRNLYIEVNKAFLKRISDHPDSTSNDLSYEYKIDSTNPNTRKIGSVKFADLQDLYQFELYNRLLAKVGLEGDVVAKMKELIPHLDENSKLLNHILSTIDTIRGSNKDSPDKLKKNPLNEVLKTLPDNSDGKIEKKIRDKVEDKIGKKLLKNLVK